MKSGWWWCGGFQARCHFELASCFNRQNLVIFATWWKKPKTNNLSAKTWNTNQEAFAPKPNLTWSKALQQYKTANWSLNTFYGLKKFTIPTQRGQMKGGPRIRLWWSLLYLCHFSNILAISSTIDGLQTQVLFSKCLHWLWSCVGVYLLEEWTQKTAGPACRSEPQRAARSPREAGRRRRFSWGGHLLEEETCCPHCRQNF